MGSTKLPKFSLVLPSSIGSYLVYQSFTEFYLVLADFYLFLFLPSYTGFTLILIGFIYIRT